MFARCSPDVRLVLALRRSYDSVTGFGLNVSHGIHLIHIGVTSGYPVRFEAVDAAAGETGRGAGGAGCPISAGTSCGRPGSCQRSAADGSINHRPGRSGPEHGGTGETGFGGGHQRHSDANPVGGHGGAGRAEAESHCCTCRRILRRTGGYTGGYTVCSTRSQYPGANHWYCHQHHRIEHFNRSPSWPSTQ